MPPGNNLFAVNKYYYYMMRVVIPQATLDVAL